MELQIFIPISIALAIAFIAIRGRYIHDFRTFDLNFFSNQILSKNSQDRKTARAYKEIAKVWIIRSLPYKCSALFWTFSIVYMFFAVIFSLLTILSAIIPPYEIIRLSAIIFPVFYFVIIAIIAFLQDKYKALFWTFSIVYMFLAVIFSLTAILYSIIPIDEIILFPVFYFTIIAFFVIFFEERLHSPKGKWRKISGFIFPNSLVSLILKNTPFGIKYLSSWKEINEEIENDNELKDFIEQDNYLAQPLNDYNILPGNLSDNGRSSIGRSKRRKIFALIAIIAEMVIFGSWVWTYTYHPLLPMVVIALIGVSVILAMISILLKLIRLYQQVSDV